MVNLESLNRLGQIAFAASCAQAILPVIEQLGAAGTRAAALRAGTLAWSAARGESTGVDDAADALFALPESDADDSHRPEYLCMVALSVVSDAIESVRAESPFAVDAAQGVVGFLSGVDFVLEFGAGSFRVEDPSNPPPPGPLALAELRAQQRTVELLGSSGSWASAVDAVEELSRERAAAVRDVLPQYFRIHFGGENPRAGARGHFPG